MFARVAEMVQAMMQPALFPLKKMESGFMAVDAAIVTSTAI